MQIIRRDMRESDLCALPVVQQTLMQNGLNPNLRELGSELRIPDPANTHLSSRSNAILSFFGCDYLSHAFTSRAGSSGA
jgi:hypothetical protein